jgi:hypothetical protein
MCKHVYIVEKLLLFNAPLVANALNCLLVLMQLHHLTLQHAYTTTYEHMSTIGSKGSIKSTTS